MLSSGCSVQPESKHPFVSSRSGGTRGEPTPLGRDLDHNHVVRCHTCRELPAHPSQVLVLPEISNLRRQMWRIAKIRPLHRNFSFLRTTIEQDDRSASIF